MNIQTEYAVFHSPEKSQVETRPAAGSLSDLLRDLVRKGKDVELSVDGIAGNVILMPDKGMYLSNIRAADQARFFQAPRTACTVTDKSADYADLVTVIAFSGRPIAEVLWMAGYYQPGSVDAIQYSEYHVISLKHWPNLTRLPQTPNTMRIAALLARRSSGIGMAWRKLRITQAELYRFINAADFAGYISVISSPYRSGQAEAELLVQETQQEKSRQAEAEQGFLSKLWERVRGM